MKPKSTHETVLDPNPIAKDPGSGGGIDTKRIPTAEDAGIGGGVDTNAAVAKDPGTGGGVDTKDMVVAQAPNLRAA